MQYFTCTSNLIQQALDNALLLGSPRNEAHLCDAAAQRLRTNVKDTVKSTRISYALPLRYCDAAGWRTDRDNSTALGRAYATLEAR